MNKCVIMILTGWERVAQRLTDSKRGTRKSERGAIRLGGQKELVVLDGSILPNYRSVTRIPSVCPTVNRVLLQGLYSRLWAGGSK